MADLKPGNYGEYEQVNGSSLWINWSWDISLNEVRGREPGPGLFYGQIREKHNPEKARDCVVKCHQFTEQAEESVKAERKRFDAHIDFLTRARHVPSDGDRLDRTLAQYVVFSYPTERIDDRIDAGGFKQSYILQPQELCCTTLQDFLLGRHEDMSKDFGKNYAVRRQLLENIALGLKFLHKHGRCHRKLEPTSIMLKQTGCNQPIAKLSDFTLVKEDKACYSGTTRTLNPGSIGYMAPELCHRTDKEGSYEKSMDVFSLGIVAYQIMAMKDSYVDFLPHPFLHDQTQEDMFRLQEAIDNGDIPQNWHKDLDPQDAEARNLIECLLQRDPALRPDIDEVLQHPFFWTLEKRMLQLEEMAAYIRNTPGNLARKEGYKKKSRSELEDLMDNLFPLKRVLNVHDVYEEDEGSQCRWDTDLCGDILVTALDYSTEGEQDWASCRTGYLASLVRHSKEKFLKHQVKPGLLKFFQEVQGVPVLTWNEVPVLIEALQTSTCDCSDDALLALYFKVKFPKMTMLFKTAIQYFKQRDRTNPAATMSACCRLFYRQHAEPGAAQGCEQCKDRKNHFCFKNFDGAGITLPMDTDGQPELSRFAVLRKQDFPQAKLLADLYDGLDCMCKGSAMNHDNLKPKANLKELKSRLASLQKDADTVLHQLREAIGQVHLLHVVPKLCSEAHGIGEELVHIRTSVEQLPLQQQQQDVSSYQALSCAVAKQLKKMCEIVPDLQAELQTILKNVQDPYTIGYSLEGLEDQEQKYILAKCWVHVRRSFQYQISDGSLWPFSRYYLLVPFPLPQSQPLGPALSPTGHSAGLGRTPAPSICPGGCRCSKVLKSFCSGENSQCPMLHGPSFVLPSCKLCSSSACHICTKTYHGGYMPVDIRGDGGRVVAHFDHKDDPDLTGIYTSSDYDQREIKFAVNAAGNKGDLVPLNWSPNHADCPFSAYCPYPASCLFNHGRQDEQLLLQQQCSKCDNCLLFMQGQYVYLENGFQVQQGNQLNHICNCRNYNYWKALETAASDFGQCVELHQGPICKDANLYKLNGHNGFFVAAVQHVEYPNDYEGSDDYFLLVPLRVFSTKSEEEVCPMGCHCPEGIYCQKSHLPHGTPICNASMVVGTASDVTRGVSSSSFKQAWKVSPITQAKTPSSTQWVQPVGPSNSRAVVSARQPSAISQVPSVTQEAGRAALSKMTLSTNKGKKKNEPEDKITLADLRGK